MDKDFIWIDESYDHRCINENKFYVLCALKITATRSQIHNTYSKNGNSKGESHNHILKSYESTKKQIIKINKGKNKSKTKLRIPEFHESQLLSNKRTRRIKTLFLKRLFNSDPNIKLEIYYVYYNFKDTIIKNNKQLYQNMAKELLNLCCTSLNNIIILDICLDRFTNSEEHKEVIDFIRKECNLNSKDLINFDESQSNYGLQAVDNVVGTIRRYLNGEKDNEEDYDIIKDYISNFSDVSLENKKALNM